MFSHALLKIWNRTRIWSKTKLAQQDFKTRKIKKVILHKRHILKKQSIFFKEKWKTEHLKKKTLIQKCLFCKSADFIKMWECHKKKMTTRFWKNKFVCVSVFSTKFIHFIRMAYRPVRVHGQVQTILSH